MTGNTTAGEKNKLCCIIQILRGRRKIDSPGRQFWKAGQEEKRYDQDCGSRRGRGPRAHRKSGKKVRLFVALDHLNLDVKEGEIFGPAGPNGSGKTTAINCMLALLKYDKGMIRIFGQEMAPDNYLVKKGHGDRTSECGGI